MDLKLYEESKNGWTYERQPGGRGISALFRRSSRWQPRWIVLYRGRLQSPILAIYEQRSDASPPYSPMRMTYLDLQSRAIIEDSISTRSSTAKIPSKSSPETSVDDPTHAHDKGDMNKIENFSTKRVVCSGTRNSMRGGENGTKDRINLFPDWIRKAGMLGDHSRSESISSISSSAPVNINDSNKRLTVYFETEPPMQLQFNSRAECEQWAMAINSAILDMSRLPILKMIEEVPLEVPPTNKSTHTQISDVDSQAITVAGITIFDGKTVGRLRRGEPVDAEDLSVSWRRGSDDSVIMSQVRRSDEIYKIEDRFSESLDFQSDKKTNCRQANIYSISDKELLRIDYDYQQAISDRRRAASSRDMLRLDAMITRLIGEFHNLVLSRVRTTIDSSTINLNASNGSVLCLRFAYAGFDSTGGNSDEFDETTYISMAHSILRREMNATKWVTSLNLSLHRHLCTVVEYKGFRCLAMVDPPTDTILMAESEVDYVKSSMAAEMGIDFSFMDSFDFSKDLKRIFCSNIHQAVQPLPSDCLSSCNFIESSLQSSDISFNRQSLDIFNSRTIYTRPELCRLLPTLLEISSQKSRDETSDVSNIIRTKLIPELASNLDSLDRMLPVDGFGWSQMMHDLGLNVAYLGVLAQKTQLPHIRDALILEMVSRCVKVNLRSRIREATMHFTTVQALSVQAQVRAVAIDSINSLFKPIIATSNDETKKIIASDELCEWVLKKFGFFLTDGLFIATRTNLLRSLVEHCGIIVSNEAFKRSTCINQEPEKILLEGELFGFRPIIVSYAGPYASIPSDYNDSIINHESFEGNYEIGAKNFYLAELAMHVLPVGKQFWTDETARARAASALLQTLSINTWLFNERSTVESDQGCNQTIGSATKEIQFNDSTVVHSAGEKLANLEICSSLCPLIHPIRIEILLALAIILPTLDVEVDHSIFHLNKCDEFFTASTNGNERTSTIKMTVGCSEKAMLESVLQGNRKAEYQNLKGKQLETLQCIERFLAVLLTVSYGDGSHPIAINARACLANVYLEYSESGVDNECLSTLIPRNFSVWPKNGDRFSSKIDISNQPTQYKEPSSIQIRALETIKKCHDSALRVLGRRHSATLGLLDRIGRVQEAMGIIDGAIDAYIESFRCREMCRIKNTRRLAQLAMSVSRCLERVGNLEEALNWAQQALSQHDIVISADRNNSLISDSIDEKNSEKFNFKALCDILQRSGTASIDPSKSKKSNRETPFLGLDETFLCKILFKIADLSEALYNGSRHASDTSFDCAYEILQVEMCDPMVLPQTMRSHLEKVISSLTRVYRMIKDINIEMIPNNPCESTKNSRSLLCRIVLATLRLADSSQKPTIAAAMRVFTKIEGKFWYDTNEQSNNLLQKNLQNSEEPSLIVNSVLEKCTVLVSLEEARRDLFVLFDLLT